MVMFISSAPSMVTSPSASSRNGTHFASQAKGAKVILSLILDKSMRRDLSYFNSTASIQYAFIFTKTPEHILCSHFYLPVETVLSASFHPSLFLLQIYLTIPSYFSPTFSDRTNGFLINSKAPLYEHDL